VPPLVGEPVLPGLPPLVGTLLGVPPVFGGPVLLGAPPLVGAAVLVGLPPLLSAAVLAGVPPLGGALALPLPVLGLLGLLLGLLELEGVLTGVGPAVPVGAPLISGEGLEGAPPGAVLEGVAAGKGTAPGGEGGFCVLGLGCVGLAEVPGGGGGDRRGGRGRLVPVGGLGAFPPPGRMLTPGLAGRGGAGGSSSPGGALGRYT
jgi:hypothetical protein